MNIFALTSLSFGMSMDAFAAATAKGATNKHSNFIRALQAGLFFGVVEAVAPLIGYGLGSVVSEQVASIDHWLAFVLLTILGVRFIVQAFNDKPYDNERQQGCWLLVMTAIATSVDSMVVGVSLAFLHVNIGLACLLIGVATTIMATLGLYLGNRLGQRFGRWAMALGGVVLMVIGVLILYSHLTA